MNFMSCALVVLVAITGSALGKSVSRTSDPCALMRCANGPCVNGTCTNNKCPPNMHEEECGSACPARCDLDPAASMCIALCVKSCFCDEGFVLEKADGICIRQENCPKHEDKREEDKCALIDCRAGLICRKGSCIRNPNCPVFKLRAPKPGCQYVDEINEKNCPIPKEHCPA